MNCAVHPDRPATAYCRTCGKPLCEDCKRDVMGAIYCEPCIAASLHGKPPVRAGMPNPSGAAVLGLIPGVGAWYNGQFAKGFAHVVIFVLLIAAADKIHGAFGILVGLFPVYCAFEAWATANARLQGHPAPDPLGIEKLLGIKEPQHNQASATPEQPAGVPSAAAPVPPAQQAPPLRGEPVGAFILIGLGVLFLLSNLGLIPQLRNLLLPLILIGLGVWIAYKRMEEHK
ncbi:MAG TPA: B-box zinc finger protein [Candidatus Angelobacter sp.]|nr:B-box zinc finger protein [Candidatus Angelobacter sp.]